MLPVSKRQTGMADQPDDDALFDRLAKSLEAVRHDAELARTGGVAGVSVSLTRAETELHRITAEVADLQRRVDAQERSVAAGGSAVAQSAAELRSLREAVESLSRRVEAHEARLSERGRSWSWPAGRIALVIALIIVILGGAAAWAGFGVRPTPRELADRFVSRVAELTGFQSVVRREPATAAASPAPVQASEASVPTGSAPASSAVSPGPALFGDSVASNPTPAPSTPAPAPTAAAGPAPAPSASATQAVAPPAGVTAAPVAAPSAANTETASALSASAVPASATPATVGSPPPLASQTIDAATQAPAAMSQAQPPRQVLLRATADSWVEIRQKGGRTLLRRTLRPGETWPIPADPTLLLSSGNAGVLELVVDGVATRLAPAKGGMIHDMPLDPESIAADLRSHP
jgi:cytoskeleton protein RodZ